MTPTAIAQLRRHNQQIGAATAAAPSDLVQRLGAVQAQDYPAAKWALGLRAPGLTDAAVEQAFTAGTILRTHIMRPTWHFVTPADIRWMLALTAPRVQRMTGARRRALGLEASHLAVAATALTRALAGGKQLTRPELETVLRQADIPSEDNARTSHILMHAELAGLICSGARRAGQFTYALLDERAPATAPLARDEAIAALTQRYFAGHGPATVKDFGWWSGLAAADIRAGLAMTAAQWEQTVVDGQTYWFAPPFAFAADPTPTVDLLPNFDEYTVAYSNRTAVVDAEQVRQLNSRGNILFSHTIVLDGRIAGTWRRTRKKEALVLETHLVAPLTPAQSAALAAAAARYAAFLGLPIIVQ